MRVTIHVRPGSARPGVGGGHDGALVVRVGQPAERGAATEAALRAVAAALGVPARAVTLAHGATSRRKVLDVAVVGVDEERCRARLARLLAGPEEPGRPT